MNPNQLFSAATKQRMRAAAFERPPSPIDIAALDIRISVMKKLGFRPAWVHEWFPAIPLETIKTYFAGEPIRADHIEMMTDCAWRVVMAAQELLLEMSLANRAMVTNRRWLAFARRIYDAGSALDSLP
jgi:hypothetical protein